MSLRLRIVLALLLVALIPMAVALVVPLMQAERRARTEAEGRLATAQKQASALVQRRVAQGTTRFAQAAAEFAANEPAQRVVKQGPESLASAQAEGLARRHALDWIQLRDSSGTVLAQYETRLDLDAVLLKQQTSVDAGGEPLTVEGGTAIGRELLSEVQEVTTLPIQTIDKSGRLQAASGVLDPSRAWLNADIPIGDSGWLLRVSAPGGDVVQARHDTLLSFLGIAPFALGGALALGLLLAHTIARPVRALTDRAEQIAAERARPILLPDDRNEVRRLQTALEQMLDALDGSEQQRLAAERIAAWEEVARRLAHEVKNPLSPIKLAVENLRRTRERAPEQLDRALDEETTTILEEVEGLKRLVDEFSEFARFPKLQCAPCDVREVVHKALALHKPRLERMLVSLVVDDQAAPPSIMADAEQLGRAVKNLVQNALDAMESVKTRQLTVTLREVGHESARVCELTVRDSGVGVSAEAKRRVFEPYFTTKSHQGGTGLGMAIVQRIVTEHGGTIALEGEPGRGATVTIRLPSAGMRA